MNNKKLMDLNLQSVVVNSDHSCLDHLKLLSDKSDSDQTKASLKQFAQQTISQWQSSKSDSQATSWIEILKQEVVSC